MDKRTVVETIIDGKSKEKKSWIEQFAKLLDSKFKIPGTDMSFGVDPLIGLIPGAGDVVTYIMSALLIIAMFQKGASGKLVMKMLGNAALDMLVGSIPILGSIFDFTYKANDRNVRLFNEYQVEGKHKGTGLGYILLFIGIIFALLIVSIGIAAYTISLIAGWVANL
ncbi:MAG: DUF4112 domain-containing protein [Cryomorphaceae bacterium]|nr:DUF4112 domain-containing protein [Cryomorphaceae bacterium]